MRRLLSALLTALLLAGAALAGAAPARADTVFHGKLEIEHRDDFQRGKSATRYRLAQGRRHRRLLLHTAPRVRAGARVAVRGRRVGSAIRGSVRRLGARAAAVVPKLGPHKTAVIAFNFATDTRQPWTPDYVRQRVFTDPSSANAFYREQSWDQVQLVGKTRSDGDVHGWYSIDAARSPCDVDLWAAQARSKAQADGVDLTGYDHLVYLFPAQPSCSWAGLAELPGNESWLNGYLNVSVVAHELGHNMGVHHASSLRCTSGGATVAISDACTSQEYGDPFDVMGTGQRHSSGRHLEQLGYLAPANVQTVTASGTYTLRSAISQTAEAVTLRVPRTRDASGAVSDYYYLEYRTSGGVFDDFSPLDPVVNGVSVRVAPGRSVITQSKLLDTTPGSANGFLDGALGVGRTLSDGTVSVTTTAISGQTATVAVTMGGLDSSRPTPPGNLRGGRSGGGVRLAWDPSADDRGVARYAVHRNGIQVGWAQGPSFEDLGADPRSAATYQVAAFDAAGNRSELSAPFTVGPDRTDPVVRILRPGAGHAVRGKVLIAAVATDEGGVARMELWIDGDRRARAPGRSLSYRWRPGRRGSHRIEVRAFDHAGNMGSRSLRVGARSARRRTRGG